MSRKQRLRRLLLALGRQLGAGSTRQLGALALCHHRVDDSGHRFSLSFEAFREQMKCLADSGAQWIQDRGVGCPSALFFFLRASLRMRELQPDQPDDEQRQGPAHAHDSHYTAINAVIR